VRFMSLTGGTPSNQIDAPGTSATARSSTARIQPGLQCLARRPLLDALGTPVQRAENLRPSPSRPHTDQPRSNG
jgi:hypothetical protein